MRALLAFALPLRAALLALAVATPASAGVVTGSAMFSGGYYTYSYTLTVSPSEVDGVSLFALADVAGDIDVGLAGSSCDPEKGGCGTSSSTFAASGWATVLDAAVTDDAFFSTAIPASPNSITTGFGFYSTVAPVPVQYYTIDDLGNIQTGMTIGPSGP